MFKKIEIWIVCLILILSLFFTLGFGTLVRLELTGINKFGWFSKTALKIAEIPLQISTLVNIVRGNEMALEDRFPTLDGFQGKPNLQEYYLLLSRHDGDLKEGVVELVDLRNFQVLHTWNPDIDQFNKLVKQVDEFEFLERDRNNHRNRLLHPKLLENGGLIFTQGQPLRQIDHCGNLVFQVADNIYHHSIEIDSENIIWAPAYLYPYSLPANRVGKELSTKFQDDAIVKISPAGQVLYKKSVSQIFIDNGMEYLLTKGNYLDPIHLNDIQPVNFDGKYWKKGDLFLSLRNQSMVILYRPSLNKIIWKGFGRFFLQHDVDILDDQRIAIFNNNVKNFPSYGKKVDGYNEVIIYDFESREYTSYLKESLASSKVRTIGQGLSEILPNNDLFVEETNYGRTLYFNADGSLRWTHLNRARDGKVYYMSWSRILYTEEDLFAVKNLIALKGTCND